MKFDNVLESFIHNNETYVTKSYTDNKEIYIRVFKNEIPANIFVYSSPLDISLGINAFLGYSIVDKLVLIAKSDVVDNRIEKY